MLLLKNISFALLENQRSNHLVGAVTRTVDAGALGIALLQVVGMLTVDIWYACLFELCVTAHPAGDRNSQGTSCEASKS